MLPACGYPCHLPATSRLRLTGRRPWHRNAPFPSLVPLNARRTSKHKESNFPVRRVSRDITAVITDLRGLFSSKRAFHPKRFPQSKKLPLFRARTWKNCLRKLFPTATGGTNTQTDGVTARDADSRGHNKVDVYNAELQIKKQL